MKKFTLALVALVVTTASYAQVKLAKDFKLKSNTELRAADLTKNVERTMVAQAPFKAQSDGVYYARPRGTYWVGGTSSSGDSFSYLVVPPFTELTFFNASDNVENCSWTYGSSTTSLDNYVDENGNLKYRYGKVDYGYVTGCPVVSSGGVSYQIADYVYTADSVAMTLSPYDYGKLPVYYGYQGGDSPFMNGEDSFDFDGDGTADSFWPYGFRQFFERPATPLKLHEVAMIITSTNNNFSVDNLPLTLTFNKASYDEEGNDVLGDEIAVLKCTNLEKITSANGAFEPIPSSNVYRYYVVFSLQKDNEFGTLESVPVLIDDRFAITVGGFKDIDVRFYFTDQGEVPEYFYTWASPTLILPGDADGNPLENGHDLRYYNVGQDGPYCYNIYMDFFGELDGLRVETQLEMNHQIAPVEGGDTMCPPEEGEDEGYPAYLWTNYPIFDEDGEATDYYDFEGIPEWASLKIDPSYYEYGRGTNNETRGLHMVWFEVEPLPAGEKGRVATVKVVGETGLYATDPIYIIQGDAEIPDAAVSVVKFDASGKAEGTYNLSGQRVGKDFKGLVIKNGKKYVVK